MGVMDGVYGIGRLIYFFIHFDRRIRIGNM